MDLWHASTLQPLVHNICFGWFQGASGIEQEEFVNFLDPIAHESDETLVEER